MLQVSSKAEGTELCFCAIKQIGMSQRPPRHSVVESSYTATRNRHCRRLGISTANVTVYKKGCILLGYLRGRLRLGGLLVLRRGGLV